MKKLEIRNLSFEYKENTKTLDDVSFSASMGEFICILGHNGSGKSTLAKLIMGLLKPTSGEILIDGVILNEETVEDLRGKLGIVFQNPDNQFVGITVKDDIAFGLENRNINRGEMLARIEKYSKQIGIEHLLNRNPESLSGGEKQKVAIAGILACEPDVIIFDESTSMLDPKSVKDLLTTIKELKGEKTILYITHNLDEALKGGLKHPNCTHNIIFPNKETKENNKYSSAEWTGRYNAKQKKQALELQRSRLKNDNKIFDKIGNQEMVDKNNQKIRRLNKQIKEQKKLM